MQLHYYRVTAPSAGIVGDIPVRVGDRVTTTTPLTTVDKPGSLEAYVYVPIERSSQLKPNLPVQILDQSGTVIAESRINFISPQVDSTTQTVLAKAPIANSNDKLRNAQFIHARIVWGSQDRTVVPVLAVSRLGGQYFAFVAEQQDGKTVAHQKPLTVGDMTGNNYVVLEGIKPGDKIIVSGTQFLVDGAPVLMPQGLRRTSDLSPRTSDRLTSDFASGFEPRFTRLQVRLHVLDICCCVQFQAAAVESESEV